MFLKFYHKIRSQKNLVSKLHTLGFFVLFCFFAHRIHSFIRKSFLCVCASPEKLKKMTVVIFPYRQWCMHFRAIYTRQLWAEPTPGLAQAEHWPLHLHLWSGPDLNKQFDVIMAPNVSSACNISRPQLCISAGRWQYSGTWASLNSVLWIRVEHGLLPSRDTQVSILYHVPCPSSVWKFPLV